jgi:hypothetical protein
VFFESGNKSTGFKAAMLNKLYTHPNITCTGQGVMIKGDGKLVISIWKFVH